MSSLLHKVTCLVVLAAAVGARAAAPVNALPLALPEGYTVQAGAAGQSGAIHKQGTPFIRFEIGAIPKQGAAVKTGNFKNRAVQVGRSAGSQWMKTENVNGQPAYFAYDKDNTLYASFPIAGINFSVASASSEQVQEALNIFRTFAAN